MSGLNGAHGQDEPLTSGNVFTDLTISMIVLMDQFSTVMDADDVPTRRLAAAQMEQHLNCVLSDVGAVRAMLERYPTNYRRSASKGRAEARRRAAENGGGRDDGEH
jgi:hypothetical protein